MTPERWQTVERVYHAALSSAPHERAAFLNDACADDDALRQAVDALLTRQPQAEDFLEAPAWHSVAAALAGSLTPIVGRVIGSFEVISHLGSGGMGEVYRARDRRLGRDVALKFLTPALAPDHEARERLRREALAASALNHPHICTLHDIVDDEGRPVLVMEIVEGDPLSTVIPKEGLPIETVIRYGEQLADALAHAHAHGIIHRDLKPSNIVVTPEGRAKVLDFGIARQMRAADLAAVTHDHTVLSDAGSIAGTLRYLAPEVLAGQPADARSDIWALGVVLYEMATGMRPFEGSTGLALTSAILHESMAPLPARVPGTLRAILQKCLAKEPSQRYQSAAEVRAVLEMTRPDPATAATATSVASETTPHLVRGRWVAVAALVGVVAVIAAWTMMRPAPASLPSRMTITLGPEESFANEWMPLAISPDGRRIAYAARRDGQQRLYLRALDRFEATPLAGTEGGYWPFFSPDGLWLGFFAGGKLQKVSIEGGRPVTLCDAPRGRGADWGPDNSIIFAPNGDTGLSQVSAAGGAPRILTTLNGQEGSHRAPQILPGGRMVLFTVLTGPQLASSNRVLSLETGQSQSLVDSGSWARYVPDGHLMYVLNGVAVTAPFDRNRLTVSGPPTPVLENLSQSLAPSGNLWPFAVSANGSLVFVPGGPTRRSLMSFDRHGVGTPVGSALRAYEQLRLSPDGQRLALTLLAGSGRDIWIYELAQGRLTPLTTGGKDGFPVWSPDGARIAFASGRFGHHNMFVQAADGSGPAERLVTSDKVQRPRSWSPDGRMLSFTQDMSAGPSGPMPDLWTLSFEQPPTSRPMVQLPGYQVNSRISPDGRWLAYASEESGQYEVYVASFPDGARKSPVSSGGGNQPVWATSGRELFYFNGDKLMAVDVNTGAAFHAGKPALLFQVRSSVQTSGNSYDVTLDGQRFVMIQGGEDIGAPQVNVVLGWSDELSRRARARQH